MKKFLGGSAIASGVLLAGLMAGYWHFADLMPRRDESAPLSAGGSPAETEPVAAAPAEVPQPPEPPAAAAEPPADQDTPDQDRPEAVAAIAPPAAEEAAAPAAEVPAVAPADPAAIEAVEDEPAVATGEDAMPEDQGDAPSFELLRVEPDGSAVVAGQSTPGDEIVLRRGGDIIARDTVGPSGDFALALEVPLGVGDHELRLETTDPQGRTLTSPETAIVSVPPRGREEELLVVVEAPNAPSRILAVPAASEPEGGETVIASAPEVDAAPIEETPDEARTAMLPMGPATETADDGVGAAPIVAIPSTPGQAQDTGPDSDLAIAAVEIEGKQIYIAGTATSGSTVRLYLDDDFVAEADGGAAGEFIAEATVDLPVGPHIVRADEIGADGTVLARVEVPFDRPEGTSMAALAPSAQAEADVVTPEPDSEAPESQAPEPADTIVAAAPPPRQEPAAPSTTAQDEAGRADADGAPETAPVEETVAETRADPVEIVPEPAPAPTAPVAPSRSEPVIAAAPDRTPPRSPTPIAEPAAVPDIPAAPDEAEQMEARVEAAPPADDLRSPQRTETPSPERPSRTDVQPARPAAVDAPPPAAIASAPPAPVVTASRRQAALEPVVGRVIIRRGDTLWRISKNAYGLGSRFSVIYLANGDQIRDPDRIYPGQVFRMPGGRKAEGRSVLN